MDYRTPRRTLGALTLLLAALVSTPAIAEDDPLAVGNPVKPPVDNKPISKRAIDTENFEFGVRGGVMSVEDFESGSYSAAVLTYHITEDFFVEARSGQADVGESSFERLSGGINLLTDEERSLRFHDLSLGINLFPGEAFILDRWAVNTSFFVVAGAGATEFAGNDIMTVNAGVGYRVIVSDFMTFSVHMRDRVFETEITGEPKDTHNLEYGLGLSIFF